MGGASSPRFTSLNLITHPGVHCGLIFSPSLGSELNKGWPGHTLGFTRQTVLLLSWRASLFLVQIQGQEFGKCIVTKSFSLGASRFRSRESALLRRPQIRNPPALKPVHQVLSAVCLKHTQNPASLFPHLGLHTSLSHLISP